MSVKDIIYNVKPNEIYNLSAQSHVAVSFQIYEYANVDALGTLRILDSIRSLKLKRLNFIKQVHQNVWGYIKHLKQKRHLLIQEAHTLCQKYLRI